MAAGFATGARLISSRTPRDELCRTLHDMRTRARFPRRDADLCVLALGSHLESRMSASLNVDDTMIVPKLPVERAARPRRVTTQFGPEPRAVRWPWLIVAALFVAAVAQPIDPVREVRLSATAQQLLQAGQ